MSSPVYVDWAITRICNLNCRHCVGMESVELNHEEAVRVANDIISLKPQWVILEGGEPLMRPDLAEVGTMFRRAGIDVYVITNGNAFTEAKIRELAAFSAKVLFSIDGASSEVYEYIKRGAKFNIAKEWAIRCAQAGIFQGMTTVLSRLNIGQIPQLIELCKELGGKSIIFLPLKPFGNDTEPLAYYRHNALSAEEQAQALKEIYRHRDDIDIFYDEPFMWNMAEKLGLQLSQSDSGITIPEVEGCAASYSIYIQTDGSVRPCMFSPARLNFGNATKEPLPQIWQRMRQDATLVGWAKQESRSGACSKCSRFASCRGCLARTTILLGDPLAADPCCPFRT
ncbi:MAG: radical SAM protein [Candidatus Omnitrophica bacterium]|nr:radical SAM protein [Candidatus Omnitrophota bacterium]